MRWSVTIGLLCVAVVGCSAGQTGDETSTSAQSQTADRMNQMIPLLEQGQPIFGVGHPAYVAFAPRNAGPDAPPPEQPDLAAAAAEMVAYQTGDYEMNNYSPNSAEQYRAFMEATVAAGGSARTNPFISKIPIMHDDPEGTTARLINQLNDGQVMVVMQEVETVEEVDQVVAGMRFTSKGGIRPEEGFERAAAYWGMTEAEYLSKADVWPLNPEGELLLNVIIESVEGAANAAAIAAHPAVAVVTVGAGTMGGVFSSRNEAGERVRDDASFDAAVSAILTACKNANKSCGYPANTPAEVEALMAAGWDFLIMQRRDQDAFDAVETGLRISGRAGN